jgi:isoleucyl-tRNA synthetase
MRNFQTKDMINYYGLRYIHPVDNRECPVVVGGDYITTETGTGLVHTAPGHGQEDYVTGQKYGLPILSPVDDNGIFTEEAGQFSGLDVLGEGNTAVVKYLDENLSLIMEESYRKLFRSHHAILLMLNLKKIIHPFVIMGLLFFLI